VGNTTVMTDCFVQISRHEHKAPAILRMVPGQVMLAPRGF
jgi:hypothetical protein